MELREVWAVSKAVPLSGLSKVPVLRDMARKYSWSLMFGPVHQRVALHMSQSADARDLRKSGENWRNIAVFAHSETNLLGNKLCCWFAELEFQTISISIGAGHSPSSNKTKSISKVIPATASKDCPEKLILTSPPPART